MAAHRRDEIVVVHNIDPKYMDELTRIADAREATEVFSHQALAAVQDRFTVLNAEHRAIWERMRKEYKLSPTGLYRISGDGQLLCLGEEFDELRPDKFD